LYKSIRLRLERAEMSDMTHEEKQAVVATLRDGDRVRVESTVIRKGFGLKISGQLYGKLEDLVYTTHRIEKVDPPHDWTKPCWAYITREQQWVRCHGQSPDDLIIVEGEHDWTARLLPENLTPIKDLNKTPEWVRDYEAKLKGRRE